MASPNIDEGDEGMRWLKLILSWYYWAYMETFPDWHIRYPWWKVKILESTFLPGFLVLSCKFVLIFPKVYQNNLLWFNSFWTELWIYSCMIIHEIWILSCMIDSWDMNVGLHDYLIIKLFIKIRFCFITIFIPGIGNYDMI